LDVSDAEEVTVEITKTLPATAKVRLKVTYTDGTVERRDYVFERKGESAKYVKIAGKTIRSTEVFHQEGAEVKAKDGGVKRIDGKVRQIWNIEPKEEKKEETAEVAGEASCTTIDGETGTGDDGDAIEEGTSECDCTCPPDVED
jgi:hypothetical protein